MSERQVTEVTCGLCHGTAVRAEDWLRALHESGCGVVVSPSGESYLCPPCYQSHHRRVVAMIGSVGLATVGYAPVIAVMPVGAPNE